LLLNSFSTRGLQVTQHYSKPGVTAVEVLPVFPDFEVGCNNQLTVYTCILFCHSSSCLFWRQKWQFGV